MAANTVVRARIDPRIKDEAADILAATGLTVSDAFRMIVAPNRTGFGDTSLFNHSGFGDTSLFNHSARSGFGDTSLFNHSAR